MQGPYTSNTDAQVLQMKIWDGALGRSRGTQLWDAAVGRSRGTQPWGRSPGTEPPLQLLTDNLLGHQAVVHLQPVFHERHAQLAEVVHARFSHELVRLSGAAGQRQAAIRPPDNLWGNPSRPRGREKGRG